MNSVERVKKLCKDRKIPISRLEKELGFANGYISQLRKGVFPSNRLVEIAEYFGVSVDYLLGQTDVSGFEGGSATGAGFGNGSGYGGPIEKAPAPEGEHEMAGLSDIYFSLAKDLQDAKIDPEDIRNFARIIAKNMQKSEGEI